MPARDRRAPERSGCVLVGLLKLHAKVTRQRQLQLRNGAQKGGWRDIGVFIGAGALPGRIAAVAQSAAARESPSICPLPNST